MSSAPGTTKTETISVSSLRGEGSMLREEIQRLKAKEGQAMRDLREAMQDLERVRYRLEIVNTEIARRTSALGQS